MFPTGLPGVALLILRASVAFALILESYSHWGAVPVWVSAMALPVLAAITAGFLTPIAAVLGLLVHMLIWYNSDVCSIAGATVAILDVLALALLGPGAYSIDSYRFGRRVLRPPQ
jgi:hypothetical protein